MNEFMFQLVGFILIYGGIMLYGHLKPEKTEKKDSKVSKVVNNLFGSENLTNNAKDTSNTSSKIKINQLNVDPEIEKKYNIVWYKISQMTEDDSFGFKKLCYGKFEYLERLFRDIYQIPTETRICHYGSCTDLEFPVFVLGFMMARNDYQGDTNIRMTNAQVGVRKEQLLSYAEDIMKLLTWGIQDNQIKEKIKVEDIRKIINDYKSVPLMAKSFSWNYGINKILPKNFRGFVLGHYAGSYRIKKDDLAKMCWSWESTKKFLASENENHKPQNSSSTPVAQKQCSSYIYERKVEPDYVANAKGRVVDTASSNPKSNYGVIAKQMVQGSDPYGAIWERMKNDIGISNGRFKRRLNRNTSRLENMYREQRTIPAGRELFNRRGYVDDDFFAFILGYILTDHLFDADDKLVAEAASRSSNEDEVEPEYDEVNSWDESSWDGDESSSDNNASDVYNSEDFSTDDYNRDELDFDELEFMEPWERRQALEDAGFDPDDFDFDYDSGSSSRNVTFQDDYGGEGDDMYSFDGEFIE